MCVTYTTQPTRMYEYIVPQEIIAVKLVMVQISHRYSLKGRPQKSTCNIFKQPGTRVHSDPQYHRRYTPSIHDPPADALCNSSCFVALITPDGLAF